MFEIKEADDACDFPALYKSTNSDLVILFVDESKGLTIRGHGLRYSGSFCDSLKSCFNKERWFRMPSNTVFNFTQK